MALQHPSHAPLLAESFGYSEHSSTNTMALLKQDLSHVSTAPRGKVMSPSIFDDIKRDYDRMPPRPVLDFLIQYHVRELNW